MDALENNRLKDSERTLIAMGAAMGAGCRTCADKLYEVARQLGVPEEEMREAFRLGLSARVEAAETMRVKAAELVGTGQGVGGEFTRRLRLMIRTAAFAAANSAPDALAEIQGDAAQTGLSAEDARLSISMAKMVRKNAAVFSDGEIAERAPNAQGEEMCCPLAARAPEASACSCS